MPSNLILLLSHYPYHIILTLPPRGSDYLTLPPGGSTSRRHTHRVCLPVALPNGRHPRELGFLIVGAAHLFSSVVLIRRFVWNSIDPVGVVLVVIYVVTLVGLLAAAVYFMLHEKSTLE